MSISLDDQSLLERWIDESDADAFKVLCSRHAGMVYATSVRILRNETEAEDVAQSCFESLSGLRKSPRVSLGPWLHKVATNRSLNVIKSDQRRKAREKRFFEDRKPHTEILWEDIYGFVDEAIEGLPEKLRVAVVSHFIEDQTHECIARREGVSRAAITQRIQRGIHGIRKALKRRGIPVTSSALSALLATEKALAVPPPLAASLGKLALAGTSASIAAKTAGTGVAGATLIPGQLKFSTIGAIVMKTKTIYIAGAVLVALAAALFMALGTGPDDDADRAAAREASNRDSVGDSIAPVEEEVLSTAKTAPSDESLPAIEGLPPKVTGIVLDPDGDPVEGASLGRPNAPALATTDAEGYFEIETLPKGINRLSLKAEGFEESRVNSLVTMWDGPVYVEAVQRKPIKRMIRVVDAMGQPVAGAEIRLQHSTQVVATTDPEGWFEAPSYRERYIAFHPMLGTTKIDSYDHPAGGTVRLKVSAKLKVRVERNGMPVPGAEIRHESWQTRQPQTSITGENGTVVLEGLDGNAATLLLNAILEQPDGTLLHGTALARPEAGATTQCVIALSDPYGGVLRGRLLWDDGSPVEGGQVRVGAQARGLTATAEMSADGYFEVPLFLGENIVYEWNFKRALVEPKAGRILVSPGATEHYLELRLVREAAPKHEKTFALTLDYRGRPRPSRLMLLANAWTIDSNFCWVDAPEEDEIIVHFDDWSAPNRLIAVDAESGYGVYWHQWGAGHPRTTQLRLDVPLTTVSGVALDQHGERIAYSDVTISRTKDFPVILGQANASGEFTLWPVPAGQPLKITVSAAGCEPNTVEVTAGETSRTLRLTLARRESVLGGQVVYEDVRGRVAGYQNNGLGARVNVDALVLNGRFSQAVVAGTWTLQAIDDFAHSEAILAHAPAENLVLVLQDKRPSGDDTQSEEIHESQMMFKQFGLIFRMFANENPGSMYPRLSRVPGGFYPEMSEIYPEYLNDPVLVERATNQTDIHMVYLGHMVDGEEAAMTFLDAYDDLGPEAVRDSDLLVAEGLGTSGGDTIYRLSEEISVLQSTMPTMWKLPGAGRETGGWVLYMDGHVEWIEYPGRFPMTETFVTRMRELQAEPAP